jgi:hypothetical protein
MFEQFRIAALRSGRRRIGMKPQRAAAGALFDYFFQADERAAADEKNIGGVDRREFLMRMLAPALWRNVGDRALENF